MRFLQNERVAGSSEEIKRNFLAKKGLSEEEIQAAFTQAGAAVTPAVSAPPVYPDHSVHQQQILQQHPSFSSRIKDLLNILLLIGGFSYGVRYLWKVLLS